MSIYSIVTEQDLINLRKLAEQQKNQCAIKIENRISKQTHDRKLAENLSPILKKLDVINESTQKLGENIKESNSENETPQLAIEKTQNDIQPGVIYDTLLENTLSNMKKTKRIF